MIETNNFEVDETMKKLRLERFKTNRPMLMINSESMDEDDDQTNSEKGSPIHSKKRLLSWEIPKVVLDPNKKLKGLNQELEKDYLRPSPSVVLDSSNVRPISILKKQFKIIREKLLEDDDYNYFLNQIKSIRQDLVVQGIENKFTVKVYTLHSRIALEQGDLNEYNQCQSRLQELKRKKVKVNNDEMDCYRLIHSAYQNQNLEIVNTLREISDDIDNANKECIKKQKGEHYGLSYSMRILRAFKTGDSQQFLKMYLGKEKLGEKDEENENIPPYYSVFLLDFMLSTVRNKALLNTLKSYIKVDFIFLSKILGFTSSQESEMKKYLIDNQCKFAYDDEIGGLALDCKLSTENRKVINNNNSNNSNNMNEKNSIIKRLGDISNNSNKKRKGVVDVDSISNSNKKHTSKKKKR